MPRKDADGLVCMQSAKAIADGFVSGKCVNAKADVFVQATTDAKYTVIEGCAQGDSGSGNGSGSTDGSTAEGIVNDLSK